MLLDFVNHCCKKKSLLLLGLSLMAKEKLIQVEPHHRVLEEKSFRKGANVSNLIDMVRMVATWLIE